MAVWLHPSSNREESRCKIEKLSTIIQDDDRFIWSPLPGLPDRKCIVRKDTTCRDPRGDTCAAIIEQETLSQFAWPAAVPFAQWVTENHKLFCGKKVLELGSGTGIMGFVLAAYAESVVLSDSSLVSLAMLKLTVEKGSFNNCSVASLHWGSEDVVRDLKRRMGIDAFDIVVGSDVFYFNSTLKAGLRTAKAALQLQRTSSVGYFLCASVARSERMEVDLDEVPVSMGFTSQLILEVGSMKLFKWTLQC